MLPMRTRGISVVVALRVRPAHAVFPSCRLVSTYGLRISADVPSSASVAVRMAPRFAATAVSRTDADTPDPPSGILDFARLIGEFRAVHVPRAASLAEGEAAGAGGAEAAAAVAAAPGSAVAKGQKWLHAAEKSIFAALATATPENQVQVLEELARLGAAPGKPYTVAKYFLTFLTRYGEELDTLRDGETIAERAAELRVVLRCFHAAGVSTDRLRLIYGHIERDFPVMEAAGAILPMPAAVNLLHTMLSTSFSSPSAVIVLLRATLREPLTHFADDSQELRLLKMIEMLLRVDFLSTLEQLPPDIVEYLSVVRSLRYYDQEIRRDTPLSYQLAYFLRKHSFPAKRLMLGPYPLKVCDPQERVNFEPVEEREFIHQMTESPVMRKRRHLEAVGWRHIEVRSSLWDSLSTYEAKAAHVRSLLKDHSMIDP